jgi:DNA mismatch endonuclease (patch repair protein)
MPTKPTSCNPNFTHGQTNHRTQSDSDFPGERHQRLAAGLHDQRAAYAPIELRRGKQRTESVGQKGTGGRHQQPFSVRPDFVFPKLKTAVFVDGCFWHGCPRHATQPRTNAKFWRDKIAANCARDRRVNRTLRALGWTVIRVWEHEFLRRDEAKLVRRLHRWFQPSR